MNPLGVLAIYLRKVHPASGEPQYHWAMTSTQGLILPAAHTNLQEDFDEVCYHQYIKVLTLSGSATDSTARS